MTMSFRPLAAFACMAALALGGVGSAQAQGTPKRGGTAVIGVSVAGATLNTQLTSAVTPLIIADLWADGLYKYEAYARREPQRRTEHDTASARHGQDASLGQHTIQIFEIDRHGLQVRAFAAQPVEAALKIRDILAIPARALGE